MSGSDTAYSELVAELWRDGESFLIIEHDIQITVKALRQARHCPCDWSVSPFKGPSAYGYAGASLLTMSLGCTRFRAPFMHEFPDAVAEANAINDAGTVVPPGDWRRLDCRLYSVLRGSGADQRTPHIHDEVPHHHQFDYGCSCGHEH